MRPVIIVDVPEPLPVLPAAVEVAAYRISVEALMNVVRHAAAKRCEVRLALGEDELRVDVVDDGRGVDGGDAGGRDEVDAGTGGRGRRRGDVESMESGGTRVVAHLPIDLSAGATSR